MVEVPDSWESCDPETVVIPKALPKAKAKVEEQFERNFDLPVVAVTWHEPVVEKPKPTPVASVPKVSAPAKDMAGRICKHGFFPNSGPACRKCEDEAEDEFDRRLEEAEREENDDCEWPSKSVRK